MVVERSRTFDFGFHHHLMMDQRLRAGRLFLTLLLLLLWL